MMTLSSARRLIVPADFTPPREIVIQGGRRAVRWVRDQVLELADCLKGTDVYLKVNSALRACGYELIQEIHARGLGVFADLKIVDIGATMRTDGVLLREAMPELLSVMCLAGSSSLEVIKSELPNAEVIGVTVLTNLNEDDTFEMFDTTLEASAMRFALIAEKGGLDGLVCAPKDISAIRSVINQPMTLNVANVRPECLKMKDDDQNSDRAMTAYEAIRAGADRVIVGRPIIQSNDPYDAVMKTIKEIGLGRKPTRRKL